MTNCVGVRLSNQSTNDTLFQALLALHSRSDILSSLNSEDLHYLAAELTEADIAAGEVLVQPGDTSDRIWLVLEGRLTQSEPGVGNIAPADIPLGPGAVVGEVAFALNSPHQMTVKADQVSRLVTLSRQGNLRLLNNHSKTWQKLSEYMLEQMRKAQLAEQLERLFGPFGKLRPYVLRELEGEIEWVSLKGGEYLMRQGDSADEAYILMTGRLRVATEDREGHSEVISEVSPGETVGEIALITECKRTATIFAARDSELVKISRHSFNLMLERSSKAMGNVSRIFYRII